VRQAAAVAVGRGLALAQLDCLAGKERGERGAGCLAGVGACAGLAGLRRQWNFNRREADFPPIVEKEAAAIGNGDHLSGPGRARAADPRGGWIGLREGVPDRANDRSGQAENLTAPGDTPTPTHGLTERLELGGTAAGRYRA
jgi:hypothetical protein